MIDFRFLAFLFCKCYITDGIIRAAFFFYEISHNICGTAFNVQRKPKFLWDKLVDDRVKFQPQSRDRAWEIVFCCNFLTIFLLRIKVSAGDCCTQLWHSMLFLGSYILWWHKASIRPSSFIHYLSKYNILIKR